jgi:hypothetical protein
MIFSYVIPIPLDQTEEWHFMKNPIPNQGDPTL